MCVAVPKDTREMVQTVQVFFFMLIYFSIYANQKPSYRLLGS